MTEKQNRHNELEEQIARNRFLYAQESHIAKFYHRRSQILTFNLEADIAVSKDGDAYVAMIGNCLADAKAVGFGNSELKALIALVEDRTIKFAGKFIESGTVYCVGVMD